MMKTRSLTAILTIVLVALVAGLRIWTEGEAAQRAGEAALELPGLTLARPSDDAPDFAARVQPAALALAGNERVAASLDPAAAEPVWLEGRVVFRAGSPRDEVLFVDARGDGGFGAEGEAQMHRVRVGQDGRFRVAFAPGSKRGWLGVAARYHYLNPVREIDLRSPPRRLVLEPRLGGRLVGRVHAPARAGLAGVTARLRGGRPGSGEVQRFARLDESGRFELSGLPAGGDWWLSITAPHLVDLQRTDLSIASGEVNALELELRLGVSLAGLVVDEHGAPVAGATLRVDSTRRRGIGTNSATRYARSEADGSFAILGLEPGDVVLACEAPGARQLELALGELRDGERRASLELALRAGEELEGVVLWPDGTPAAGARVRVTQVVDQPWRALGDDSHETLASDGRFRFGGLEARRSRLVASARREGAPWIAELSDVAPGARGLVLTLGRGARVRGRAHDDRGEALERFELVLTPRHPERVESARGQTSEAPREPVHELLESADGRFELGGVPPGSWSLVARAEGHADAVVEELDLPADDLPLELEMARLARVSGRVVDPLGKAVPHAIVGIREREPEATLFGPAPIHTLQADETGRFTLEGVPPGAFELAAVSGTLAPSAPRAVDVEAGGVHERLELRLRRPARLTGEVHVTNGAVVGRVVELRSLENQAAFRATTTMKGQFAFEDLAPGEYALALAASDAQSGAPAGAANWRLREARREELQLELSSGEARHVVLGAPAEYPILVRGVVLEEGRGVPSVTVTARGAVVVERPSEEGARTDASGRFEMTLDGAGPYAFSVGSEWGATIDFEVEVPQRRLFEVELALPTASLSGIVRGPAGEPLAQVSVALVPRGERGVGNAWALSATTDERGRYEFRHLRAATYDLQAGGAAIFGAGGARRTFGRVLVPEIGVAEGERRAGFDLTLRDGGAIEGVVLGSDGEPLARARLDFEDARGRPLYAWSSATTDARGRFRQEGLGAGRVRVRARHDGHASEVRELTVVEGGTSEVRLVVEE